MKKLIFIIGFINCIFWGVNIKAQNNCDNLYLDIDKGTLNGFPPTTEMEEVMGGFPCYTGISEEGGDFNCGGGVFFINHDFYFYTYRDYIDVRSQFKGKASIELLGKITVDVINLIGKPCKKKKIGSSLYYLYKKSYGTLVLCFSFDEVKNIMIYGVKMSKVQLCY